MSNIEKYGVIGDSWWSIWEAEYEEIRKAIKFGKEMGEKPFLKLQEKIVTELDKCYNKRQTTKKALMIGIIFSVCFFIIGALTGLSDIMIESNILLFTCIIVLPIALPAFRLKSVNKQMEAIYDFDKKFFDGQIFFAIQNNLPL